MTKTAVNTREQNKQGYRCYTIENIQGLCEYQFYQGMLNDGTQIAFEKQSKECLGPVRLFALPKGKESNGLYQSLWTLFDYSTKEHTQFSIKACISKALPVHDQIVLQAKLQMCELILKRPMLSEIVEQAGEVISLDARHSALFGFIKP